MAKRRFHIKTGKHRNAEKRVRDKKKSQQLLVFQNIPKISCFNIDLCKTYLSAYIPFNKLSNLDFKNFLEKYTKGSVPDQSTLQKG